jgi:peptidoglycan/xylan/chitin deacetylase (PgdA/CDA1 family)
LETSLFAAQVRHLAARYRLVEASELIAATRGRRRGMRFPVAITFDDDLSSHAEVAAPILASAGAKATFFVSGASLRGPHRYWWERLQAVSLDDLDPSALGLEAAGTGSKARIHELGRTIQSLPPRARDELDARLAELVGADPPESGLRADALRRLAESGVEIGFHTRRHDLLPGLDSEELFEAMRDGRSDLEQVVGRPLRTISYPYGEADARVAAAARGAGFQAGFTGIRAPVTPDSDPLLLGRLAPSHKSVGELAFGVAWTLLRATVSGRARATTARPGGPATLP